MIPLRDINPRSSTPVVTIALIIVNSMVWLYELSLPEAAANRFIYQMGMIPARLEAAFSLPEVSLASALIPLFTSIFLHGGWMHVIGNMWFLWVFGDNVEDRLGHLRYLLFYVASGVGAGILHTAFDWGSSVPALGASGAISGVMGAYLVLFPRSRVVTLVPLIIVFFTVQLPAFIFLGYWFVLQFINGMGALGQRGMGGVAWWAHIGGFAIGVVLALVLPRKRAQIIFQ
jgi:membrane associated rhomboid family serine protease